MKALVNICFLFPALLLGQYGAPHTFEVEPWREGDSLRLEIARASILAPDAPLTILSEKYEDGKAIIRFIYNHPCFRVSVQSPLPGAEIRLIDERGDVRSTSDVRGSDRFCMREPPNLPPSFCDQKLYPNPNYFGKVYMNCSESERWYIQDLRGRIVKSGLFPLDLSGLPDGTYMVFNKKKVNGAIRKYTLIKKHI